MKIEFSELMEMNYTLKFLNRIYVDIYVVSFSDFEVQRNINLTWEVESFKNKTLMV